MINAAVPDVIGVGPRAWQLLRSEHKAQVSSKPAENSRESTATDQLEKCIGKFKDIDHMVALLR